MNLASAVLPAGEPPVGRGRRNFGWATKRAVLGVMAATLTFQLAFEFPALGWLVLVSLACLFDLRLLATARQAFYAGLIVGLGIFIPQTGFLWTIFGPVAVVLWLILAFFHGLFVSLLNRVEAQWGTVASWILAPMLWCGIEYFRCEVWWLRFTWFAAASPFQESVAGLARLLGTYGLGALAMGIAGLGLLLWHSRRWRLLGLLGIAAAGLAVWGRSRETVLDATVPGVQVVGIQLEFPGVPEVSVALTRAAQEHPSAEMFVLSEYTFDGPVPDSIRAWCAKQGKWLIAGGKEWVDPATNSAPAVESGVKRILGLRSAGASSPDFFNTAYVIGTNGQVVFRQAKSRPIQFFADGLPARSQEVWASPWGPIGIAICYDLSYRQVVDGLIRRDARALIVPTMDVESWGPREHQLNARMTRIRATEYGVPIFRVASSGISQWVVPSGRERAVAPFPGSGASIEGLLSLDPSRGTRLPLDSRFAPMASAGTGVVLLIVLVSRRRRPVSRAVATHRLA